MLTDRFKNIQTEHTKNDLKKFFLMNTQLKAANEIEACNLTYHIPVDNLEGVIVDLYSSLIAVPKAVTLVWEATFINCVFRDVHFGCGFGSSAEVETYLDCKRNHCLSTNHSNEVRIAALRNCILFCYLLTTIFSLNDEENNDCKTERAN